MPSTPTSRLELDLTGTSCPMAFVKTRVHLDQCENGEIVQILYEDTAANEPLARSIMALGHKIVPEPTAAKSAGTQSTDAEAAKTNSPARPRRNTLQLKRIRIQVKK